MSVLGEEVWVKGLEAFHPDTVEWRVKCIACHKWRKLICGTMDVIDKLHCLPNLDSKRLL